MPTSLIRMRLKLVTFQMKSGKWSQIIIKYTFSVVIWDLEYHRIGIIKTFRGVT